MFFIFEKDALCCSFLIITFSSQSALASFPILILMSLPVKSSSHTAPASSSMPEVA